MDKLSVRDRRGLHWHNHSLLLILYDLVTANLSFIIALWLRFDCRFSAIEPEYLNAWLRFIPAYTVFCLLVFLVTKLYKSIWKYASYTELIRVILAVLITGTFHAVCITFFIMRMPISYYLIGTTLQFIFLVAIRFSYRFVLLLSNRNNGTGKHSHVMIIGAGDAGQMILRDINNTAELNEKVVCFIDDNPVKWNHYIDGVPIVGGRDYILQSVDKYGIQKIYLAIPSASAQARRDILNICNETGCELNNLPGMYQFMRGDVTVNHMKKVSTEDLLGRDPIRVDMSEVFSFIKGRRVLVTGGGGSIGSELCRQIAAHSPEQLIIFDVYENNAYEIQMDLKEEYPDLDLVTLIGSVRDSRRIFGVFREYRPQIVYHAAAHKHVPMMEDSPNEAIKNNVLGTYKTAYAAMVHGCERFVLISTDKAVNPTNIMGASKRLCEMIIQCFDAKVKAGKANEIPQLFTHTDISIKKKGDIGKILRYAKTEFVAVRFGNVLGSNGSVIPLFKKMIERGGPVKVTHPDIIRYFMTIPEAVSLVLLAGTYAEGGQIFVLDMGNPVKIDTLARNLIRMYGYEPDVDIQVQYTSLRPGEKLYEEKLMAEEGLTKTENDLIHIGKPIPFDFDTFLAQLKVLMDTAYANDDSIRELVQEMVTTYHPAAQTESVEEKKPAEEKGQRKKEAKYTTIDNGNHRTNYGNVSAFR